MPVHAAGPRLYRSVSFKHLVKGAGAGGSRASNIALNLTPFVDMMTILVTFLLMVFSASGELITAQKGLELPLADDKTALQEAPVIVVSKSEISYNGMLVATGPWTPPGPDEEPFIETVRYRTVGDMTCTGAVRSEAATPEEIVVETAASRVTERGATRADDRFSETAMEDRKREGYF